MISPSLLLAFGTWVVLLTCLLSLDMSPMQLFGMAAMKAIRGTVRPGSANNVRLVFKLDPKRRNVVVNPVVRWTKALTGHIDAYIVNWTINRVPGGNVKVPQDANSDTTGYSSDFSSANPSVTLNIGDVVIASVTTDDALDNLLAPPVVSNSLTIPTPPVAPGPAQNVVLSLT